MDYKNTKSNRSSTLAHMAGVTNSLYNGKGLVPRMMNGSALAFLKTVRPLMFGTNLVVTVQALHNTFRQGLKISPGGLRVTPSISQVDVREYSLF
jgi:hypothetical protein